VGDDEVGAKAIREMAEELFTMVDFDDSGEINEKKFVTLVTESLALEFDKEDVKKCFKELDSSGDGQLSISEFKEAIIEALEK
jgi:Ca2+-binding EF-hand superfamily protein